MLRREKEEVLRKAEQRLSSEMALRKSWKAKEADMKKRLEEKELEISGLQSSAVSLRGGDAGMGAEQLRAVRSELKAGITRYAAPPSLSLSLGFMHYQCCCCWCFFCSFLFHVALRRSERHRDGYGVLRFGTATLTKRLTRTSVH